ncbi:MAG: O-antigen ligase family protein [Fimbriimonadaceae bacterium]|nr:O-antigen ligase family protein [Chitinophagales bacterium]
MESIRSFKQYRSLRQTLLHDAYFILLCAAVLVLPFHKTLSFIPLFFAGCLGILIMILNRRTFFMGMKPFLISASVYLIFIYAYYISENKAAAKIDLQIKLSLLLIPLIMGFVKGLHRKLIGTLITLFVISCCIMSISAVVLALNNYFLHHENTFYYKELVAFSGMHPAYLGMYISFSIICITHYIITKYKTLSNGRKIFLLCICAWFLFFLLLLTARTALIVTLLFANCAYIYWGKKYEKLKFAVITCILVNVLGFILLLSLPTTRERFETLFIYKNANPENSANLRDQIWHTIFNNTETFWLQGIGNGDDTDALISWYQKDGFTKGVAEKYNAHNQFLQIWIMCGIGGLLYFIIIYVYQIRFALKRMQYPYFFFLLLFILNCLTESMLETQSGVIFFTLFNALYISLATSSSPEPLQ